ncbi:capsular exopolysaccharide synthesis family protein [Lysobacter niastensis]|uniref:non-specific protein-tyrosine kinase n=1 Tax=Lysobacter niastensis TaxID=380629 RepID=A0ABU1WE29_9GAMM|nr:polysaccharide biosynthesis tyrosine autokinase [Lysobacter niastensis]MDR7135863.1 capsular exopolysaccharide synthesis family protein [Lysobacter niastensis]
MTTMTEHPLLPEPLGQEPDSDEINLLEYWRILRERQWLVVGVTAAVALVALVLTLLATPVFRAGSTLQIERETIQLLDVQGLQPAESPYDIDFYQTQYELLQSRSLAQRVVQDLRLVEHPYFAKTVAAVDEAFNERNPGKANALGKAQAREDALVGTVMGGLTVEPVRNSRLVRVNFDSPDPQLAARISNGYGDAFIASNIERRFDASSYAKKYLEDRLTQLKGKLEDSERDLVTFSEKEQIVSVGEDKPSLDAQNLGDINSALAAAQSARIKAEAQWRQASTGDGLGLPQVVANTLIQKLREQRATLSADYQQKLGTMKPDYPDMVRLHNQIGEVDRQIATEVGNVRAALQAEYGAAQEQETLLQERIAGLKSDVLDLQGRSIQYNILKREAETNRQLYDALLQRYKEIGVAGGIGANNISVVDRAQVPDFPHSPRKALNLAVGLLLGGFLGVLLAFLLHYLDKAVHNPKALETASRRPVLGAIPLLGKGATPAQAVADLRSPFSEAYRSVRTALQFATSSGLPRSLLISSAGPAEGKTTTAVELARNIAQLGKRVVLIDADLRKPSVHRALGLTNEAGLSNLLAGAAASAQVVQTMGDGLSVITSGPIPPSPPELLGGHAFAELLQELGQRFDVVVLDGPPVLGLADAPLLAHHAAATLLVAAAGETRSDAIDAALRRLNATGARVLGSVLTRFDAKRQGENYGYAYEYGGR